MMPRGDVHSAQGRSATTGGLVGAADVASIIEEDEDIRARIKLLLMMALEDAIRTMRTGSNAQRTAMTRSLLPAVTKAMAAKEDTGMTDLRRQLEQMTAAAFGGGGVANGDRGDGVT